MGGYKDMRSGCAWGESDREVDSMAIPMGQIEARLEYLGRSNFKKI